MGCILCVGAMAVGVALLNPLLGDWSFVLMYSNRGPFAMGLTFCVFLLGLKLSQQGLSARARSSPWRRLLWVSMRSTHSD